MDRPLRTLRRRWALAISWNAAVLMASFGGLSAAHTGSVVEAVLHLFAPSLDPSSVATIHFGIRKLAHLTEYGILSTLYVRAQRPPGSPTFLWRWAALAVSICATTAVLDEWHQSFVPSRTGSPRDVIIDVIGAILSQLLLAAARRSSRAGAAKS